MKTAASFTLASVVLAQRDKGKALRALNASHAQPTTTQEFCGSFKKFVEDEIAACKYSPNKSFVPLGSTAFNKEAAEAQMRKWFEYCEGEEPDA